MLSVQGELPGACGRQYKMLQLHLTMLGFDDKDVRKYISNKHLIVDLSSHALVTLVLAGFFYYSTGRISWVLLSVLGGILIDLDHFLDHFLHFGKNFRLKDFLHHSYLDSGNMYIFFHSWEIVVLFWVLSLFMSWMVPLAAGMTVHLMLDQSHMDKAKLFYFLTYRWYHGFKRDRLAPHLKVLEGKGK